MGAFSSYVGTYVRMGRKVQKTLSLMLDVAERLEEEENQSETVERALEEYWGEDDG